MTRVLYIWGLVFVFCTWTGTAQQKGSTEEERFRMEIDAWMRPYRTDQSAELDRLLAQMEARQAIPEQDSTYKHINAFYLKNRKTYRRLRLESLERCPRAPEAFPGYTHMDMAQLDTVGMELEKIGTMAQQFMNIRTLNVLETSTIQDVLLVPVFKYLQEDRGMTLSQLMESYSCGNLIFAGKEDREHWQVTRVNRVYITRYRWNIDTNVADRVEVWINNGEVQPEGWLSGVSFTADTPKLELAREMTICFWSLYDRKHHNVRSGCSSVSGFMETHREQYVQLRGDRLRQLPGLPENWEGTYHKKDNSKVDEVLLSMERMRDGKYRLPESMSCTEFGFENTLSYFRMRLSGNSDNTHLIKSWLTGHQAYAMLKGDDIWQLTALYGNHAISFTWNIRTDEIVDLQYLEKNTNKPGE
ncbi:hypothetical protein ED312_07675 [Sinomicrobium pectinilyticum]|uniref:Uncharacterized protein n=1 Tax=Sinomicrobium pectinilyticum TaxID=1084421 RepID=A0A3N0EM76_SINP1|nr:hypothetical protein [Sinomicrobium pectinilyticum]RNL89006.1 hypothetical protein ED312_07675 [Sinomicrobium pectinilyticum]